MNPIYFGIDFECAGGVPALHAFTQFGAVAYDSVTEKKIDGFNMYANMNGYTWEERCLKEFWEKNQTRYKETIIKTGAAKETPYEVVDLFIKWLRKTCNGRKCVIFSDNMIYDGGLLKYFSNVDIMYLAGEYTTYCETSSVYEGMYAMRTDKPVTYESLQDSSKKHGLEAVDESKFPDNDVTHDHNPENDASVMMENWFFIQNGLKKQKLTKD